MKHLMILPAALVVAACGGGGNVVVDPNLAAAGELNAEAERLILLTDGINELTEALPDNGVVTYTGFTALENAEVPGSGFLGEFSADVDFAAGRLDGSATNFQSGDLVDFQISNSEAIEGELVFESDFVDVAFSADISGSLEIDGELQDVVNTMADPSIQDFTFLNPDADTLFGQGGSVVFGSEDGLQTFDSTVIADTN